MHFEVPFHTTCHLFSSQRISMLYTVCLLLQWTPSQSGLCLLKSANEFEQNMYDNCKGCIAGWSNKHM